MAEFTYERKYVFPEKILTNRLKLVRMTYDHISVKELYEMYSELDRSITKYVTFEPYEHPIESQNYIEHAIESFEEGTSATYLIIERESGDLIGTTGFEPDWDKSIAQSGVFLFEEYWGNGYSTERGEAMLELAFEEYDFESWISKCDPNNEASVGAIENYVVKNGGRKVGVLPNQVKLEDTYTDILYFVLDKEDYFD